MCVGQHSESSWAVGWTGLCDEECSSEYNSACICGLECLPVRGRHFLKEVTLRIHLFNCGRCVEKELRDHIPGIMTSDVIIYISGKDGINRI